MDLNALQSYCKRNENEYFLKKLQQNVQSHGRIIHSDTILIPSTHFKP
ncbi:Uncharacterized protein ChrSV_0629 [Chromobacterium vaccinii]|nr:Uncharacterized protein ChrSW_0629 [Chromobacterium vaccinii]QND88088.1 Uncharacterized protein ChrSV_0629 [Chromobacterium vaccinii]